jgi:hypothetical protein
LGTFSFLTCYAILSAYVHLPVRAEDIQEFDTKESNSNSSGFSLNIARLMCDLSWQAYGLPDRFVVKVATVTTGGSSDSGDSGAGER